MAKQKIVFRKEMWIDINEYYPNFPTGLRRQIDNAIYKLLGGQETKPPRGELPQRRKVPSASGAADAVILKRTPKETLRVNSRLAALLKNYECGHEYLKEDVIKRAVSQHGMEGSNVIHNLLNQEYFEIVK